jgi:hypothetical protein
MTQPDVGAERRLYGMMQHLMAGMASQKPLEVPPERGVVTLQDALDAVMQAAAVIDEETQAGRIPVERGIHVAAMLMVIRDYIQSLPPGLAEEGGPDLVTPDLEELVTALRLARRSSGLHG